MTQCYLATSTKIAGDIVTNGFSMSNGKFGYAYNFSKNPKYAYEKASCPDVIIFAKINVGRCMSESSNQNDLNLSKINSLGYDSVQNSNEISVFESKRIEYCGYVQWDRSSITFNLYNFDFFTEDFKFLTNGKKMDVNIAGKVNIKGDLVCDTMNVGRYKKLRNEDLKKTP